MNLSKSTECFERARRFVPGGVDSPVRAFKSVGGNPRFIEKGSGAYVWDVDGNRYIDYVLSWGPLILGHAYPSVVSALGEAAARGTSYGAPTRLETELAELVCEIVPSVEMVRFVNSGTEATMSALRLARGFTKRDKIVKFSGCYHGHADMLLASAGSGVATLGLPDSPGVPAGTTADTIVVPYNKLEGIRHAFAECGDQIAAVIVEPIAGNMGFIKPDAEFLSSIQTLCREHGALFVLDEVMTGFRAGLGGAQELFSLDPDLTCLGKVIGGGLPIGAYAGKREVMQHVAPDGPVYQAGTLSGNPLAVTAGLVTLRALLDSNPYQSMEAMAQRLLDGLSTIAGEAGIPLQTGHAGTMFGFYFVKENGSRITSYEVAKELADTERYARFFQSMMERGVYFAPSQYEVGFLSTAHQDADIDATLEAFRSFVQTETS